MKSIMFTVQIQADFNERGLRKTGKAKALCQLINEILAKYDGMTGGAQILSHPKDIKTITSADG